MKQAIRILRIILAITILISCNKNDNKNNSGTNNSNNTNNSPITDNVSFKVNDTLARTIPSSGGDIDEHLGIFTESVGQLSFDLWGDVPNGRPHRGNVHFRIMGFKFEAGSYTLSSNSENYASFTRYETINAGGSKDYMAMNDALHSGSSFTFTITEIAKDPNSFNGRDYLATGTFVMTTKNKVNSQAERDLGTQTINLTEGSFKKIRIAGGPL